MNFAYNDLVVIIIDVRNLLNILSTDTYDFLTTNDSRIEYPIVTTDPRGDAYTSSQVVTLSTDDVTATIYYTEDGTTPNLDSTVYTVPVLVNTEGTTLLKFFAINPLDIYSNIITETYIIDTTVPITTAIPAGGVYFKSQNVALSSDDLTATIHYTTDGSIPTVDSPVYSVPISIVINQITSLQFFAIDKVGNTETVKEEIYEIALAKNNIITRNVMVSSPFNINILHIR